MKRKFNIILHIGTEKTGTTTLQLALLNNKNHLIKEGFYYLNGNDLINSRDIVSVCLEGVISDDYLDSIGVNSPWERQKFSENYREIFDAKINGLPVNIHTLVISSEHFHSLLNEYLMVQNLRDLLEPFAKSFQIFCYLRRQVDLAVSFYSTYLKGGGVQNFENFIADVLWVDNHYCNYDIFLSKWERIFSKTEMVVKRFERTELIGENIIDDFFVSTGIPIDCLFEKFHNANESIADFGQVLLRQINIYLTSSDSHENEEIDRIRKLLADNFCGKGRQLKSEYAIRYQALFHESNESVRARWFPERDMLFDSNFSDNECRDLTDEQENAVSGALRFIASGGKY